MISHIFTLGAIQSARCLLGLGLAAFLIYRSWFIPLERESSLEPGDRMVFLVAGSVMALLAFLRGLQGVFTLRMVRSARRRSHTKKKRTGFLRWVLIISGGTSWVLMGLAAFFGKLLWELILLRPLPPWASMVLMEAKGIWILLTLIALAAIIIRLRGKRLRRFGMTMAVVDLINLTGFPLTTACGTYGFLIHRHPDSKDFFEGVFSGSIGKNAPVESAS